MKETIRLREQFTLMEVHWIVVVLLTLRSTVIPLLAKQSMCRNTQLQRLYVILFKRPVALVCPVALVRPAALALPREHECFNPVS